MRLYLGEVTAVVAVGSDWCVQTGRCGLCGAAGSPGYFQPAASHLCGSVGVCAHAPAAAGHPPLTACCSSEWLQTEGFKHNHVCEALGS